MRPFAPSRPEKPKHDGPILSVQAAKRPRSASLASASDSASASASALPNWPGRHTVSIGLVSAGGKQSQDGILLSPARRDEPQRQNEERESPEWSRREEDGARAPFAAWLASGGLAGWPVGLRAPKWLAESCLGRVAKTEELRAERPLAKGGQRRASGEPVGHLLALPKLEGALLRARCSSRFIWFGQENGMAQFWRWKWRPAMLCVALFSLFCLCLCLWLCLCWCVRLAGSMIDWPLSQCCGFVNGKIAHLGRQQAETEQPGQLVERWRRKVASRPPQRQSAAECALAGRHSALVAGENSLAMCAHFAKGFLHTVHGPQAQKAHSRERTESTVRADSPPLQTSLSKVQEMDRHRHTRAKWLQMANSLSAFSGPMFAACKKFPAALPICLFSLQLVSIPLEGNQPPS